MPMLSRDVAPFIREADYGIRRPWFTPPRRLMDYLLLYVEEGDCVATVEGNDIVLSRGDVCLIQPDSLHSLRGVTDTVTPYVHLDIFYNPRREEAFPTKGGQVSLEPYEHLVQPQLNAIEGITVPVRVLPRHPEVFHSTMLLMVAAWQSNDVLQRLEANHLALGLVIELLREHSTAIRKPPTSSTSLGWVTSYLSFHIGDQLSVADMARRANLSQSRFSTLFHQQFGQSPHQYFLRLRVAHARELLRTTDLPLREIAEYCGFADVHHFSKVFKRLTQQTPGSLRRS
jgi:AraC-like DNA-binding protein